MSDRPRQDAVYSRIVENPVQDSQFDGESTISLVRRLSRDPEWVWRMLTTRDGASKWSPCVPLEDLTGPGEARFRESESSGVVPGTVLEFTPDTRLRLTWGPNELNWELSPADGYTDVRLTEVSTSADSVLASAAGWHVCLATLEALCDGDDVARVVGEDALAYDFSRLRADYAEFYRLSRA